MAVQSAEGWVTPMSEPVAPKVPIDGDGWALAVDDQVRFHENPEHPHVLGVVTRLWSNGRYVTIRSDGRTFVRDGSRVTRCTRRPMSDVSGLPS